jgi:hypothetical protein
MRSTALQDAGLRPRLDWNGIDIPTWTLTDANSITISIFSNNMSTSPQIPRPPALGSELCEPTSNTVPIGSGSLGT